MPQDDVKGEKIPLGARLLKIALDFDQLGMSGGGQVKVLQKLMRRASLYDPRVMEALRTVIAEQLIYEVKSITVDELRPGAILGAGVKTKEGALLVPKGHEVTVTLLWRLRNFAKIGVIPNTVGVLVRSDGALDAQNE